MIAHVIHSCQTTQVSKKKYTRQNNERYKFCLILCIFKSFDLFFFKYSEKMLTTIFKIIDFFKQSSKKVCKKRVNETPVIKARFS